MCSIHFVTVFTLVQAEAKSSNGASADGDGNYDFDLFTIGAGSGGVRASRFAASNYGDFACYFASCLHPV